METKEELEQRLKEIEEENRLLALKEKIKIEEAKLAEKKNPIRKLFKQVFG
jgi:hypothetical protein